MSERWTMGVPRGLDLILDKHPFIISELQRVLSKPYRCPFHASLVLCPSRVVLQDCAGLARVCHQKSSKIVFLQRRPPPTLLKRSSPSLLSLLNWFVEEQFYEPRFQPERRDCSRWMEERSVNVIIIDRVIEGIDGKGKWFVSAAPRDDWIIEPWRIIDTLHARGGIYHGTYLTSFFYCVSISYRLKSNVPVKNTRISLEIIKTFFNQLVLFCEEIVNCLLR